MKTATLNKDALHDEIVRKARRLAPPDAWDTALCFYYGVATVETLRAHGVRAVIQAGSASWPRVRPEQDDGVMATHFSYEWSPHEMPSRMMLAKGGMPEMHVWVGLPETSEIVDMTTGLWPAQAKRIGGFDWLGDQPPKFFWGSKLPKGVHYTPVSDAVAFCLWAAGQTWGMERAKGLVS